MFGKRLLSTVHMDKTPDDRPSLERIMEKLSYLDNRIKEHFGGLKSDISILRHELKEEIEEISRRLQENLPKQFG